MLRASAQSNETDIDIQGIAGNASSASQGIEHGAALMAFAEAVAGRDEQTISSARQALLDTAGSDVLVDAAGVAANFQRMVRIADSIGIPYDNSRSELSSQIQEDLDLHRFPSAKNTLTTSGG